MSLKYKMKIKNIINNNEYSVVTAHLRTKNGRFIYPTTEEGTINKIISLGEEWSQLEVKKKYDNKSNKYIELRIKEIVKNINELRNWYKQNFNWKKYYKGDCYICHKRIDLDDNYISLKDDNILLCCNKCKNKYLKEEQKINKNRNNPLIILK